MLDQDTRRRIDSARDVLVGKLPNPQAQVEQITIAMIYKFMDDMDKEAMEFGGEASFFTGEFEKYSWTKIFDPKLGGHEMLALYGEAIVKLNQNPTIPQLFRDIFKNAFLPYRDPETLKMFLKIINEFHYDHSEKLGDAFEYLLQVLGSQGDAGQFRTPRHIIDFVVAIMNPQKHESICDPACGTAGFLISAYKHIIKENSKEIKIPKSKSTTDTDVISNSQFVIDLTPDDRKKLINNFVGYDISAEMVRLSLVNLYLHGFTTPKIFEYDTLTSEDRWGDSFDIILANPPFMTPKGGIRPHKKFAMQANRSEVLFVDYIMEHINPTTGRAAIIVPEGIIFQSATAYKALRKLLIDKNFLYGVVSLPAGIFQPYSGVKTSILLIDKTIAKKTDNILFLKIENDGFALGAQRKELTTSDLPQAIEIINNYQTKIRNNEPTENFINELENHTNPLIKQITVQTVAIQTIAKTGDYNLSADRYKVEIIKHSKFEKVEIGSICNLINGRAFKPEDWETKDKGGLPIIRIQNLNNKNSEYNYYSGNYADKNLVQNGDLLFSWSGSRGTSFGAHIWHGNNAILNQHIFKVEHSNRALKQYLYYALNEAVTEIEDNLHGGVGLVHITKGNMEKIQIPLPPLSIQQEIVAKIEQYEKIIEGAKAVVQNYKPQIDINPEWEMVELGSVCDKITDGTHVTPTYKDAGIPFLRVTDITESNDSKKFISLEEHKELIKRCNPQRGDVLYTKNGTIGIAKEISWDYEFSIFVSLALLKPKKQVLKSKFLEIYLNTPQAFTQAVSQSKSNTITNLHLVNIKQIKIPKLTISEQEAIVSQIEKEQSLVNANKELISIYEQKIKDEINKLWQE